MSNKKGVYMEKKIKKDNHFVQEYYLKQWKAEHNTNPFVYYKTVSDSNVHIWSNKKSTKNMCCIKKLYCYANNDILETTIDKELEYKFSKILRKIVKDKSLKNISIKELNVIVKYIIFQHIRTVFNMEKAGDFIGKNSQEFLQKFTENFFNGHKNNLKNLDFSKMCNDKIKYELINESNKQSYLKITLKNNKCRFIDYLLYFLNKKNISPLIYKFTLLEVPNNKNFFTSDTPVILLEKQGNNKYNFKGGFYKNNTLIIFPLHPSLVLIMEKGQHSIEYHKCSDILYKKIQMWTVQNAYNEVYSNNNLEIPEFIRVTDRKFNNIRKTKNLNYEMDNVVLGDDIIIKINLND